MAEKPEIPQPFGKLHTQLARQKLAEEGYELTPDDMLRIAFEAMDEMIVKLKGMGYDVPNNREEAFKFIYAEFYETGRIEELL